MNAAWDAAHPYTFETSDHGFNHDSFHYRMEAVNTTHRNGGQPLCQPTLCGDLKPGTAPDNDITSGIHEYAYPGEVQLNSLALTTSCTGPDDWGANVNEGGQGEVGKPHDPPPATGWGHAVPWGHTKDRTCDHHMGYVALARAFCDGMRTWNKEPEKVMDDGGLYDLRSPNNNNYDLEDYYFEQYSSWVNPFGQTSVDEGWPGHDFKAFGINRSTALLEGKGTLGGRPTAYVCRDYSCGNPTTDPRELARQLGDEG